VRVLIVSESPVERLRAASGLLARDDVDVVEAHTGRAAHETVSEGGIDVLVIDGDLSPEGGFSVLYEIRAAGQLHDLPTPPALVMMGREQDRWLAAWSGANEVLLKPVDPFRLAQRVQVLHGAEPAEPQAGEAAAEVAQALDTSARSSATLPDTGRVV
jgi:DNA-binding response OmpR family regulator